jgi:hypothetical protein
LSRATVSPACPSPDGWRPVIKNSFKFMEID